MNNVESIETQKSKVAAYKDLVRPFTLIMPFVGFLAGGGIAYYYDKPADPSILLYIKLLLGCMAASILNAASNAINQYYDYDIDVINKPERPLPSGAISKKSAIKFGIGAYILAIALAALINVPVLIVVVFTALITFFYSAPPIRFKQNPILSNIAMAIPRGLLLPVAGWLLIRPDNPWNPTPWSIGFILFLYVVGAATTKDYADMKGDAAGGVRTLPVILGVKKSAWLISPFFIIPFILIPIFVYMGLIVQETLPVSLLALYGIFVAWLILKDPESLALEGNHPSWKHMYLLTMFAQIGFFISYFWHGNFG